jgi:hypothetical protein
MQARPNSMNGLMGGRVGEIERAAVSSAGLTCGERLG